jgi:hypothetical protein
MTMPNGTSMEPKRILSDILSSDGSIKTTGQNGIIGLATLPYIKQRTKGDANVWELRSNNTVLTIKTIYSGDFNQWRITDDSKTLTFKTLYQNVYDGWKSSSKAGDFEVYSQWEMDPRDWIIYNKLNPEYNQPFVVAMVFIASFYSSPKY